MNISVDFLSKTEIFCERAFEIGASVYGRLGMLRSEDLTAETGAAEVRNFAFCCLPPSAWSTI